jgi:hypothetical protein
MRHVFILYLFGAIKFNTFTYIFDHFDVLTKNAPRIAFFLRQRYPCGVILFIYLSPKTCMSVLTTLDCEHGIVLV